ncbi:MAG: glycosyltransferase, partial [Thermoleophilaceae bacterium]|nr:glycosyltransferase [Thermoleophilaceae bacterium]
MRILTVGNMYPPHHLGGYEITWRSSVEQLRAAGHEVSVLTTDFRRAGVEEGDEPGVHRELRWYWHEHRFPRIGLRARIALERHNAAVLGRQLDNARPDAVCWWAMGGMSLGMIELVRRRALPAVGVVGDDWMAYGPKVDAWHRVAARRPLGGPLA